MQGPRAFLVVRWFASSLARAGDPLCTVAFCFRTLSNCRSFPVDRDKLKATCSPHRNKRYLLPSVQVVGCIVRSSYRCLRCLSLSLLSSVNVELDTTYAVLPNPVPVSCCCRAVGVAKKYHSTLNARRCCALVDSTASLPTLHPLAPMQCALCHNPISDLKEAELDHCVPWAGGGSSEPGNAQLVHRECNRAKGAKAEQNGV